MCPFTHVWSACICIGCKLLLILSLWFYHFWLWQLRDVSGGSVASLNVLKETIAIPQVRWSAGFITGLNFRGKTCINLLGVTTNKNNSEKTIITAVFFFETIIAVTSLHMLLQSVQFNNPWCRCFFWFSLGLLKTLSRLPVKKLNCHSNAKRKKTKQFTMFSPAPLFWHCFASIACMANRQTLARILASMDMREVWFWHTGTRVGWVVCVK